LTNSFTNASAFTAQSTSFFGASHAEAEAELDSYFTSLEEKVRDNKALVDVAQFLAIGGISYFEVARAAVKYVSGTTAPDALPAGSTFDAYDLTVFKYAKDLHSKLKAVGDGAAITPMLEYKKGYAKRRRQIQILGESYLVGQTVTYNVATRYVDVLTGTADDWQSMDEAGGVWAQQTMILDRAIDGTIGFYLVRKGGNIPLALGQAELMDKFIATVHESDNLVQYLWLLQNLEAVRSNNIRFSHRAQLVFFIVFKELVSTLKAQADQGDSIDSDSTADVTA